jgi:hypothetical protein
MAAFARNGGRLFFALLLRQARRGDSAGFLFGLIRPCKQKGGNEILENSISFSPKPGERRKVGYVQFICNRIR